MSNENISALFQEIYKDRKKFSQQVFEVASSDLVNMGITVVSYTLKDIRDEEVNQFGESRIKALKSQGFKKALVESCQEPARCCQHLNFGLN